MSADWYARGIAIAGAVTAACNVYVSRRTFERVKPKVTVELWRSSAPPKRTDDLAAERNVQLMLRFTNDGTTPASVERIDLRDYGDGGWDLDGFVAGSRFEHRGPEDHKPFIVPALDGTTYRFKVPADRAPAPGTSLWFQVLLSNGTVLHSEEVLWPEFPAEDDD
ncbi:hypothetical protein QA811_17290 [Streptomyces sp. B21-102]|uniref:hypothetical protein n=1 Tax=Streptomyces sp. B21-102 TaxID=3039416 RepID=UPI002FF0DE8C